MVASNSRVTRPHGNSGVVKSKFGSNLPPRAFGASVRVVRCHRHLSHCVLDFFFLCFRCCILLTFDLFPAPYPVKPTLLTSLGERSPT